MRNITVLTAAVSLGMSSCAFAQTAVPLSTYADANGFIDVQTLKCSQLAGTYQEDANALATWYSGWYNGLAHKHFADIAKGKEVEHQVIVYCKANLDKTVIQAISVIFKDDRAALGVEMK